MINLYHPDRHFPQKAATGRRTQSRATFPKFEDARRIALWFAAGISIIFMAWVGVETFLVRKERTQTFKLPPAPTVESPRRTMVLVQPTDQRPPYAPKARPTRW